MPKNGSRVPGARGECASSLHSEIRGDQNERESCNVLCSLLGTGSTLGVAARFSAEPMDQKHRHGGVDDRVDAEADQGQRTGRDGGNDRGQPDDRVPTHRDETQLHGAAKGARHEIATTENDSLSKLADTTHHQ